MAPPRKRAASEAVDVRAGEREKKPREEPREESAATRTRDDDDDDDDDDDVFLERKSHHESWSVDDSVKERFKLARRELAGFISGAIDPSARFASDASARALATEISRDEIEARRLTPSLRVDYRRAAFQVRSIQTYCISPISRFQHLIASPFN